MREMPFGHGSLILKGASTDPRKTRNWFNRKPGIWPVQVERDFLSSKSEVMTANVARNEK
jgi:hypothetical protein